MFSGIRLAPRVLELAGELRGQVPAGGEADETAIRLLAVCLAQVEAAAAYLDEHGLVDRQGAAQPLLRHLGTMLNTAGRYCDRLGLTPLARAQLGLDLTRTAGEALRLTVTQLARLAEAGEGSVGEGAGPG